MPTYRARHWTDIDHPSIPQQRQRRIGNHINYITPGGLILPTNAHVQASSAPADWVGQWDFRDFSGQAPLQFAAHDTTDPDNRAMVGLRIDDTPDVWINWKAMDVVPGVPTESPDSTTREWSGLWANSTLRWIHAGHFAKKEIVLSSAGHPSSFRFSGKTSPGSAWELTDGVFVLSQGGVVKMRTKPAYGLDVNGKYIRATLTLDDTWGPGGAYPILRLTPNADDMAAAVYPVTLDPTTTIDSTGYIDTFLDSLNGTRNYGVTDGYYIRHTSTSSVTRSHILKIDSTQLPAGTVSSFVANFRIGSSTSFTIGAYRIATANYDWVEGTKDGAVALSGEPCHDQKKYLTENWAGGSGSGCLVDGTDYVSDASPPATTEYPVDGPFTIALTPSWAEDWYADSTVNGGFILTDIDKTGAQGLIYSREYVTAGYRPYFDIDYTAPSTGQPSWIRWTPTHIAGKAGLFRGGI